MQNSDIVREFFLAYQARDYGGMRALLADDVSFSDFAYDIQGDDVRAMWRWFCTRVGVPWFGDILADGERVTASYRVTYTYEDRPIDYVIPSTFRIADGRIAEQHDSGSRFTWTRQAFGLLPALISWTPWFREVVERTARERLDAFIASDAAAANAR